MSKSSVRRSGLEFRKLDLHVHTPGSSDFNGEVTAGDVVQEALQKGLAGIAITDHNTGEWVDKVKEAAKGTELIVFPGAEITCMGGDRNIHVIALFDPKKDSKHVNAALAGLGLRPDEWGQSETLVKKTILEVIGIIQDEWDGIAILAHVESTSGVLHDTKGKQRTEIIRCPKLTAVEAKDFQNSDKQENHKRVVDLLDGNDPTYQRKLAVYQASDNPCNDGRSGHCLEGIGTCCAYFKLEQINLEGLSQCFADPDTRIRQDFEFQIWQYPLIKQIKVSGGFLRNQTVEFHSGLNSILGGKGTGKSLLIELLRFGLNQPPQHQSIRNDHDTKLAHRLGNYETIEIVFVDVAGKEYEIKRTYNPLERSPYDRIEYDPAQVMPVLFLSQNEIIRIAENEAEQLTFIDRFFDFRAYLSETDSLENQLVSLDKEMAEGLRSFSEANELETSLASLEEEIKRLDEALKHPLFDKYTQYERKARALQEQSEYISTLENRVESIRKTAAEAAVPQIPQELSSDAILRRNWDSITAATQLLATQLQSMTGSLGEHKKKVQIEIQKWTPEYQNVKQEYERHVRDSGDKRVIAAEREKKIRERDKLTRELAEAQKLRDGVKAVADKRNKLLDRLEEIYQQYTRERQARCEQFQRDSAGRLQIRILSASNVEEFRNRLTELKQGSYFRETEIDQISTSVKPRDFILALLRYAALEERGGRQPSYLSHVAEASGIPLEKMVRLADFLIDGVEYEQLLELQYQAFPQDRPEIKFNIGQDKFAPLNEVSVGQKSIALLLMALSEGDAPIVIDQPEDSLDIRSIWEDICCKLRDGKQKRQFIFTTHNSSVAVASDSDYFIILDGTSTQGRVVHSGSMDHEPVSEEVLKYLEGGVETYRRKFVKYRGEERFKRQ